MQNVPYALTPLKPDAGLVDQQGVPIRLFQAQRADGSERIEAIVRRPLGAGAEMSWLWPGRIPRGQVTLIEGASSSGKTFVALDLVARFTSGIPWPALFDGDGALAASKPAEVLLVCRQDDDGTVDRRLAALGVDSRRVCRLGQVASAEADKSSRERRRLEFPFDMPMLWQELLSLPSIGLIVIDPLSDFCESPKRLAQTLRDLNDLARESGVAIVVTLPAACRFDARGALRVTSRYRTDDARCVWCVVADPEDSARRLFVARRTSSFAEPAGLAFRLHEGRVVWNPAVAIDAGDPLGQESAIRDCLDTVLDGGSQMAGDVFRLAAQCGFTPQQVRTVAKRMGVATKKEEGFGKDGSWVWTLPGVSGDAEEVAEGGGAKGEERGEKSAEQEVVGEVRNENEAVGAVENLKAAVEVVVEPVVEIVNEQAVATAAVAPKVAVEAAGDMPAESVLESAKKSKSLENRGENAQDENSKKRRDRYARKQERRRRKLLRRENETANGKQQAGK